MFSTYPNSRNVFEFLRKSSINKEILVEPDLSYTEYPLKILDQKERGTRRKVVKMYKIQWSHHTEEEATWEMEDYLNRHYPGFLSSTSGISLSLPKFNHPISGRDSC